MFREYRLGATKNSIDRAVARILADFGDVVNHGEEMLRFAYDLLPELVEGRHTWTIRYKPGGFRYPMSAGDKKNVLPVCIDPDNDGNWERIGALSIPKMVVGYARDWPEKHKAISGSGWRSKAAMIDGMNEIYEPIYHREIGDCDILFAYKIEDFQLTPEFAEKYHRIFG
ncbi:MAG TPA: hypothetical protein HA362_03930 [Nanoarchaeota archaeon]|nr:hypothetical protein [Nanoarchaeota archaeon]